LQSFFVVLHLNNACYVYIKTGSAEESKEKSDQQPGADEDQNDEKLNQADEDQEGNLSDGEDDQEDTGQQEQEGFPETDEPANLDLPDDLQLDEEGNEGSEGRQHYFFEFRKSVASLVSRFSFYYRRFHI